MQITPTTFQKNCNDDKPIPIGNLSVLGDLKMQNTANKIVLG